MAADVLVADCGKREHVSQFISVEWLSNQLIEQQYHKVIRRVQCRYSIRFYSWNASDVAWKKKSNHWSVVKVVFWVWVVACILLVIKRFYWIAKLVGYVTLLFLDERIGTWFDAISGLIFYNLLTFFFDCVVSNVSRSLDLFTLTRVTIGSFPLITSSFWLHPVVYFVKKMLNYFQMIPMIFDPMATFIWVEWI